MKRLGDRLLLMLGLIVLAPIIVIVAVRVLVAVVELVAPSLGWVILGGVVTYWLLRGRGPRNRRGGYR